MLEASTEFLLRIDWGTVPDWVVAIAAALAAIQGWRSLSAWRKEAGGKRRLELAEEILTSVYEVADAISLVRNPQGHVDENRERPGRDAEEARLREYRDMYYPTMTRLRESRAAFAALSAQSARTRALFGDELQAAFNEVISIHNEVFEAVNELYYDLPWQGEQTAERLAKHHSLRAKLWRSESDDVVDAKLWAAVKSVEDRLRPIIHKAIA